MKYTVLVIALALIVGVFAACRKRPVVTTTFNDPISWPSISGFLCVSGRAATKDDISAGRAAFLLQDAGQTIGEAIAITIPQYAFHCDEQTGARQPCVVVQAEQARGQRLIGAASFSDGSLIVGLFHEFELLGTTPPTP